MKKIQSDVQQQQLSKLLIYENMLYDYKTIGFPGQIRKFDNQIHFNFIQIRQILSCRENYHSYSFSCH